MGDNLYVGRDLEAMSFAYNYHKWILEIFAPYLGTRLVEVGAGTGSFSEMIIARRPESLALVEPSVAMYKLLLDRLGGLKTSSRVETYNEVFSSVAERIQAEQRPDSIIYINVLEHIEDDVEELEVVHNTLGPGGRLFLFVPALRWLYGSFDRQIGHHRRYTLEQLNEACQQAGFRVLRSSYLDSAGIVTWWLKYRLLRSKKMEPGAVKLYDTLVVPPLKRVESVFAPPIGKNIVLIAEKV
ncbi:MAG: class I SAM-dependent methyltransferase [Pyrinomonadaceae bacterium]